MGLLLRSYAKKQEDVADVVVRAIKSIEHARSLRDDFGDLMIGQIVVLVPGDYDCGKTADAIIRALTISGIARGVDVMEPDGHHSCGVLNAGMTTLPIWGMKRAIIISNKAIEALTTGTIEAMLTAFDRGAKVVGVAVDELQGVVLEGRVQNTFAGWDVPALLAVGGFDSEKGVEEISPIVRLIRQHGQCVAIIDPKEKPALDIRKTADGDARHQEVMTTKITRQREEVQRVGADFGFIKSGIMPDYPQSV